jgi:hypothetical protein
MYRDQRRTGAEEGMWVVKHGTNFRRPVFGNLQLGRSVSGRPGTDLSNQGSHSRRGLRCRGLLGWRRASLHIVDRLPEIIEWAVERVALHDLRRVHSLVHGVDSVPHHGNFLFDQSAQHGFILLINYAPTAAWALLPARVRQYALPQMLADAAPRRRQMDSRPLREAMAASFRRIKSRRCMTDARRWR